MTAVAAIAVHASHEERRRAKSVDIKRRGVPDFRRHFANSPRTWQPEDGLVEEREMRREPSALVDRLAHDVIGAAIEVHRHLGPGYAEAVYERALAIELDGRGIPYQNQLSIEIPYKDHVVGETKLDFLVGRELVVEIKAVERLLEVHRAQVISYLAVSARHLGLLINFNSFRLKDGLRRVVWTPDEGSSAIWRIDGENSSTD